MYLLEKALEKAYRRYIPKAIGVLNSYISEVHSVLLKIVFSTLNIVAAGNDCLRL